MIDKDKLAAAIAAAVLARFALAFDCQAQLLSKNPSTDFFTERCGRDGSLSTFLMNMWNLVASGVDLKAAVMARLENELPQEKSHPRLQDCIDRFQAIRKQLNQWAQQSVDECWSTHQVDPQRQLAAQIQQFLDSF